MDQIQAILTISMPTLAVLVGILVNNSRLSDLRNYVDKRLDDQRDLLRAEIREVRTEIGKLEQMLTILMGKIDELDTRVARLEERR